MPNKKSLEERCEEMRERMKKKRLTPATRDPKVIPAGLFKAQKPLDPPYPTEEWKKKQDQRAIMRRQLKRLEEAAESVPVLEAKIQALEDAILEIAPFLPIEVVNNVLSPVMADNGITAAELVRKWSDLEDQVRYYILDREALTERQNEVYRSRTRRPDYAALRSAQEEEQNSLRKLKQICEECSKLEDLRRKVWEEDLFTERFNKTPQLSRFGYTKPEKPN